MPKVTFSASPLYAFASACNLAYSVSFAIDSNNGTYVDVFVVAAHLIAYLLAIMMFYFEYAPAAHDGSTQDQLVNSRVRSVLGITVVVLFFVFDLGRTFEPTWSISCTVLGLNILSLATALVTLVNPNKSVSFEFSPSERKEWSLSYKIEDHVAPAHDKL